MEFNYEIILEFLLSMKWIWLVVVIMIYNLSKNIINVFSRKITLNSDMIIRDTKYKEEDIIAHLDYIINEALDEYVLLNIKPKDIYYINTALENQIIEHLSDEIPKRISKTLLTHLSFIYSNEYIGEFIGKHIYMTVFEYVLTYNMSEAEEKNK